MVEESLKCDWYGRTCFSLQLDGITLDNFAELKTVEGLKEGSLIKVNKISSVIIYIYKLFILFFLRL